MARYRRKREVAWSPELAYAVGLITADGCLSKDGRHIDLTSKDFQQVQNFRKIVSPNSKIGKKQSGNGKWYHRVQFCNVDLYDFLIDIGLKVNKSLSLGSLTLPLELHRDFLRGYFDGDGTIWASWDKRWASSYMYSMAFASASPLLLEWIKGQNQILDNSLTGFIKYSGKNTYQLGYAKLDTRKLFDLMYYAEGLPKLDRKYNRFLEIFTVDQYA